MDIEKYTHEMQQFRKQLYQNFNKRADTAMELVDALCSYPEARSPVELSLSPIFRRTHTALYKAIAEVAWEKIPIWQLVSAHLPEQQAYWLLGVDVTPNPRPYAKTLSDRGYVYAPNPVAGNKPITIGHQYSSVAMLPEKEPGVTTSWVVPLSVQRVATTDDKELVGAEQVRAIMEDQELPMHSQPTVNVGDTSYSKPAYLHACQKHGNLVNIARSRSNRTFFRLFMPEDQENLAHRPKRFGSAFKLPDDSTWHEPDQQITCKETSRRGKVYTIHIQAWNNMLMRGKNKPKRIPMEKYPFTLVRITRYDEDGNPAFKKSLWLIVMGIHRDELSLMDCYQAYARRSDLEHFFRFGKQKLLLSDSETPITNREERWWHLVHIAYTMLWMARHLAQYLPRPWEKYLPSAKNNNISPTLVRRDFERLIQQLGTPALSPKPRGKSPGRTKGTKLQPRQRHFVVKKSKILPSPV